MSNNQADNEDLKEILVKSSHKLTNKYTKVLGTLALAIWLLVVGAWYGNHSATTSAQNSLNSNFTSQRGAGGGNSGGANFGGGFGGARVSGTISKVNGSEVTIKVDDPTQIKDFKVGDSSRVINSSSGANNAQQIPSPSASKSPGAKASNKPSVTSSGNSGKRGGFFSDPKIQECLKNEGVNLTPGERPDRTDPKVMAAFEKCLPRFGQSGATPSATP